MAERGYCASHARYFWGPRLHLVATLGGLPVAFAHRRQGRDLGEPNGEPVQADVRPHQATTSHGFRS